MHKGNHTKPEILKYVIAETYCNENFTLDSFDSHIFYSLYADKVYGYNIPFSVEDVVITKDSFPLDYLPKGILIKSVKISINNTDFPDVYIFYEDDNLEKTFTNVYHSKADNTISFFGDNSNLTIDVNTEIITSKDMYELYFFNLIKYSEYFRGKLKTRILFPDKKLKQAFENAGDSFPDLYDR